jgi:hypothetical protein
VRQFAERFFCRTPQGCCSIEKRDEKTKLSMSGTMVSAL